MKALIRNTTTYLLEARNDKFAVTIAAKKKPNRNGNRIYEASINRLSDLQTTGIQFPYRYSFIGHGRPEKEEAEFILLRHLEIKDLLAEQNAIRQRAKEIKEALK